MRNQNNRNALFFIQLTHSAKNLFSSVRIQHRGWFIKNNTFLAIAITPAIATLCFLTSRELIRSGPGMKSSGRRKALLHPFPDFIGRARRFFRSKADILFHHISDDLVIRVLEYHTGFLADLPDIPPHLSSSYRPPAWCLL